MKQAEAALIVGAGSGLSASLATFDGVTAVQLAPASRLPSLIPAANPNTYAKKLVKEDGRIDWSRSAAYIERQVRAFNPWPVAETVLDGEPLRILDGRAEDPLEALRHSSNVQQLEAKRDEPGAIIAVLDDFVLVQCGEGRLRVLEVQRPGRRRVSARDYAHGTRLVGRRLG